MKLINELQERWKAIFLERESVEKRADELAEDMQELEVALAALQGLHAPIADEQPELYDEPQEIEASSQSESCVPSLGAETDLQTSPGEAEESRDQFEEEAQLAAAIELTADVEPVLEPQEPYPDAEPLPEPEWNEPQTEGYAPVTNPTIDDLIPKAMRQELEAEQRYAQPTNPEADFWARGLAPSEPEKKHRFSIFGHKRETEDA